MLRLGVTGGIGSGKSTVCKIFEHLGVPVYNADDRAKFLIANDSSIQNGIISVFGDDAYLDGIYNRPYISKIVFEDKVKLRQLNDIVHPAVLNDWALFCAGHQDHKYIVKEAAIMLESEGRNSIDKVVLVYAPEDVRINRVMQRDNVSEEAVKTRIASQMPEEEKMKLADFVIYNDGQHDSLIQQVLNLHNQLLKGN